MQLDTQKYMKHLEGFDLTEAQKVEFIHNLANVLQSFVDRAFGQHPAQQCRGGVSEDDAIRLAQGVNSKEPLLTGKFRNHAGDKKETDHA